MHFIFEDWFWFVHLSANSQWIIFPTQSYLLLYSFWANLLHSLNCFISPITEPTLAILLLIINFSFYIISLYGIILYCYINRDLVSLFNFLLLSYIQVISCPVPLVCCLKYPYSCFPSHFCFLNFLIIVFVLLLLLLATHYQPFFVNFSIFFESLILFFCVMLSLSWSS